MKKVVTIIVILIMTASVNATIADFDDLSGTWSGNYTVDTIGGNYDTAYFQSGSASFENHSDGDWASWGGFAYSDMTDTTTSGPGNQFSTYAGKAHSGSNFAVGFQDTYNGYNPTVILDDPTVVAGLYVTNTTYAALAMLNGTQFSSPFDENDYFIVTITGKDDSGQVTDSVDFSLATGTNIVNSWQYVNLTSLGTVKTLEFTLNSSDPGAPVYVAVDTIVPEPATLALLGLGALVLRRKKS